MDINTWYWISEYMKVFWGYFLLMFLWPSVVFDGYLRTKSRLFRFSFCVTVPVVIMNTVVLTLGLMHKLEQWIVYLLFYGVFGLALLKNIINYLDRKYKRMMEAEFPDVRILKGKYRVLVLIILFFMVLFRYVKRATRFLTSDYIKKLRSFNWRTLKLRVKNRLWHLGKRISFLFWQYGILALIIIYGMVYLSYGAFQVHSYGYEDLYTHHKWVYGLIEGNIFPDGIYPAAMHCFIYCMHTLLGIKVYSILLYLQIIHVGIIFLAAYFLLRRIFSWRYTPVFVLMLFFTLDLCNADLIHSMFRLQITLPQEFGMHAVFLCALYLRFYLEEEHATLRHFWDENLFLVIITAAVVVMTHFHTALMALILCISFALFSLKKVFSKKYLIPLVLSVLCAGVISITPMAGAMGQGADLSSSIHWATYAISGAESRGFREEKPDESGKAVEEIEEGEKTQNIKRNQSGVIAGISKCITDIYNYGYKALYGETRGRFILILTIAVSVFCYFAGRKNKSEFYHKICHNYPPVIVVSVIYICSYAAPMIGLPDLLPEGRFFVPGHLMFLAVMAMPVDVLFSGLTHLCKDFVLKILSLVVVIGIYIAAIITGCFRGFLFYELSRYNAAVIVTESIINRLPQYSYTVVSPTDELYSLVQYGWHEELLNFAEGCESEEYYIPSEYIFIFVEKKPLLRAQPNFFTGSPWMGEEKYLEPFWDMYAPKYPTSAASQSPEVVASQIYEEGTVTELPAYENAWSVYLQLENRTVLESRVFDWCQNFAKKYTSALHVYYEDDAFVCYYIRQDMEKQPYNLGMKTENQNAS